MMNGLGWMAGALAAAVGVSAALGGCGETTKRPRAAVTAGVGGSAPMAPEQGGSSAMIGGAPSSAGTAHGGAGDGGEPPSTAGEGGAAGAPPVADPLVTSWVYID